MDPLSTHGYRIVSTINTLSSLEETILPFLPKGYHFLDYKYSIHGPALITYHRDVTSSQSSFHTKYPTYTVIQYEYEGDFLSVSPGSHKEWQYRFPITLGGKQNTAILFNCDLVHAGIDAPAGVERKATQYKLCHEDDISLLKELNGIDVLQEGKPLGYFTKLVLRIGSYLFTVPIEVFCRPLLQQRFSTGFSSFLQRLVPLPYFNNPEGYSKKL